MALTVNASTYNADSFGSNNVGYIGPAKSGSAKDDLVLRRTVAKPTSTFSGVNRSQAKLTRTATLIGALTPSHDAIMDISTNLPVGISDAAIDAMCADMGAFVASASFKTHLKSLKVSY